MTCQSFDALSWNLYNLCHYRSIEIPNNLKLFTEFALDNGVVPTIYDGKLCILNSLSEEEGRIIMRYHNLEGLYDYKLSLGESPFDILLEESKL